MRFTSQNLHAWRVESKRRNAMEYEVSDKNLGNEENEGDDKNDGNDKNEGDDAIIRPQHLFHSPGPFMLSALLRAFASLLHPKMLLLMILPLAIAIILWLGLAFAFWSEAVQWIDFHVKSTDSVQWMLTVWPLALIATHLASIVLLLVSVPLVLVVAVVVVSILAMPAMVNHVSGREYPSLARLQGGGMAGSVWNAVQAVFVFLFLAVVTLPLWFFPLFWPVLPVLLFAYINQRLFRYDALAEHASAEEIAELVRRHRFEFFGLGLLLAVLTHIPVFGFFMPVYAGLAFIHYCLEKLRDLRADPISGSPAHGN
jgi:CysZ protein